MKISELIAILSNYDSECEVECINMYSSWGYDEDIGSVESMGASYSEIEPDNISQDTRGRVFIGTDRWNT